MQIPEENIAALKNSRKTILYICNFWKGTVEENIFMQGEHF